MDRLWGGGSSSSRGRPAQQQQRRRAEEEEGDDGDEGPPSNDDGAVDLFVVEDSNNSASAAVAASSSSARSPPPPPPPPPATTKTTTTASSPPHQPPPPPPSLSLRFRDHYTLKSPTSEVRYRQRQPPQSQPQSRRTRHREGGGVQRRQRQQPHRDDDDDGRLRGADGDDVDVEDREEEEGSGAVAATATDATSATTTTTVLIQELRDSQIQLLVRQQRRQSATPSTNGAVERDDDDETRRRRRLEHPHRQPALSSLSATSAAAADVVVEVTLKDVKNDRNGGLNLLRLLYSLMAFFFAGILFVAAFQILLFVFMNLVADAGLTAEQAPAAAEPYGEYESQFSVQVEATRFVGTLLSLPVFLYGLASAMALAGAFVSDIWQGHVFLRKIGGGTGGSRSDAVEGTGTDSDSGGGCCRRSCTDDDDCWVLSTEWTAFWVLLGFPVLILAATLFAGFDNWWQISALAWFGLITAYYVFFAAVVVCYETQAGFDVLRQEEEEKEEEGNGDGGDCLRRCRRFFLLLKRGILKRQQYQFSGTTSFVRVVDSMAQERQYGDANHTDRLPSDVKSSMLTARGWYASLTLMKCWSRPRTPAASAEAIEAAVDGASNAENTDTNDHQNGDSSSSRCCCWCFVPLDPPRRMYSTEDILGTRRFVTNHSWSLEKVFCSNRNTQAVIVIRGKHALRPAQILSSLICSIGGVGLFALLLAALLVWLEAGALFVALVVVVLVLACMPRFRSTTRIYKTYRDASEQQQNIKKQDDIVHDDDSGDDDDGNVEEGGGAARQASSTGEKIDDGAEGIYQTIEKYRVSEPTAGLCWTVFVLEIALFFVWPTVSVFMTQNYVAGFLFVVLGIISLFRYFLNPSVLLKEYGSLDMIGRTSSATNPDEDAEKQRRRSWKAKARVTTIMQHISRGPSRDTWIWVFVFIAIFIIIFTVATFSTDDSAEEYSMDHANTTFVILPRGDFRYPPQPNLPYPTCVLAKGLALPGGAGTGLADYAFLAALAYQDPGVFQEKLDAWFGPGSATNQVDLVEKFRSLIPGGRAAVSYNLVTFELDGGAYGVLVVRGSTTPWEWLTDAQLWSGAAVAGALRLIMPIGQMWNPILVRVQYQCRKR